MQHEFKIVVGAPDGMPAERVRKLLDAVLDAGYDVATADCDGDEFQKDADDVGEMSFDVDNEQ